MAQGAPITVEFDVSKTDTVAKGLLADWNDANNRLVFQYNPPEIQDSKEVEWAEIKIPGADDALAQFASGKNLQLNLQLFFNSYGENPPAEVGGVGVSAEDYVESCLAFLHSFTETRQSDDPYAGQSPGLLVFVMGDIAFGTGFGAGFAASTPGLLCRITNLQTTRSYLNRNNLFARRATADVTLVRHVLYPR